MRHLSTNSKKGSITVEAAVAFPIFLCFFLLLVFFVKIACINIALDHAVNETAKQFAAYCYPITFLNEMEDELLQDSVNYTMPSFEEETRKIGDYVRSSIDHEDIFTKLITGEFSTGDIKEIANGIVESVYSDFKDGIRSYLSSRYAQNYFEIKSKAKYAAAAHLMEKFLQGGLIDAKNLKFVMVELPQGIAEYEIKSGNDSNKKVYEELNLIPAPDNVIIAVEYRVKVPIPFFTDRDIVTRHVAVEKAWLHGSNGVYEAWNSGENGGDGGSAGNGGSEDDTDSNGRISRDTVYITNYGTKYHEYGCEYLKKSRKPVSLDYALQKGYAPCKVCVLKTAEYVWKKK